MMKFTCSVNIKKGIKEVTDLWQKEENLVHWQDGYQGSELLSGEVNSAGAKSKMTYLIRNKPMELIETIKTNDLPNEFSALYEADAMVNTMQNFFKENEDGSTTWTAHIHYTRFNAFIPKLIAFLFPTMFKKQTQKWLDQFKEFAEKN